MGDKFGVLLQSIASFIFGIVVGLCYRIMSRKEMSAHEKAGAVATEVISGVRTVIAFNAQYNEVTRYTEHLKEARQMGMKKAMVTGIFTGVFLFIMFGSMGFVFWYGTTLVLSGEITPGTVFAVFWAVLGGAIRLGQASPQIGIIVSATLAAGDILSIIDRVS
ncbi:unnamed protein product [Toxocara canis]|uniref:ABC transmembrane type-1 domain-containing protein n=1 Tax=Toxocara canis TaxID=6265 RepID=A0A183U4Q8_TOXCA|nr:unnamed protein product [Toxocara canis]